MIEGFNNPNWMLQADRVLKEIGKEKAQEYYKVSIKWTSVGAEKFSSVPHHNCVHACSSCDLIFVSFKISHHRNED